MSASQMICRICHLANRRRLEGEIERPDRKVDNAAVRWRLVAASLLCLTVAACDGGGSAGPAGGGGGVSAPADGAERSAWFDDVTDSVGLHFVHDAGPTGSYFMPQIMGSGAALLDYDNDGRLDIYLIHNAGPDSPATNRLFHQGPDGRFTDASAGSGLDVAGYGMGAAVGDVNNDGYVDLLVTEYGALHLYVNQGDGTFKDVSREAGLVSALWATSACFGDLDRDGWLDLVIANYVAYDPTKPCPHQTGRLDYCGPVSFNGTVTRVYHNAGRAAGAAAGQVRFDDVTISAGLAQSPGPGLGVVCADFTNDRWPDIFIANDQQPNRLWVNQHDGTFLDQGIERGVAYNGGGSAEASMGVAVGDVDANGTFDLFVTHLTEETNTLWSQQRAGVFVDRTAAVGLASPRWRATGFGTVMADFNHDGALDLAIVNGRVIRATGAAPDAAVAADLGAYWAWYAERNQLFAGNGAGAFVDVSPANAALCGRPMVARGLACGDVDNDGAVDLLVTAVGAPARLYRNVAPRRGHWLSVRAVDPALNRDAYGAVVTVQAVGRSQIRLVNPGYSYLCSNDARAHFGLGQARRADTIGVVWPDGTEETFPATPADQFITVRKGEGTATQAR